MFLSNGKQVYGEKQVRKCVRVSVCVRNNCVSLTVHSGGIQGRTSESLYYDKNFPKPPENLEKFKTFFCFVCISTSAHASHKKKKIGATELLS